MRDSNGPLEEAIETAGLFAGVSAEGMRRLRAAAVVQIAPAGVILFEQGDLPSFQSVVLGGGVHLLGRSPSGHEVVLALAEAPEPLLPASVLAETPYLARARAVEAARVLMVQADVFRALATEEAALAQALLLVLSRQFRCMVRQIRTLKLRNTTERVAAYLLRLSRRHGGTQRLSLPYEKGLIASELGMTRESFSRVLATLQERAIAVHGQSIEIRDPESLRELSAPDPLTDRDPALALPHATLPPRPAALHDRRH